MSKILVVNNGGQWTHRIWRVIGELGHESEIIPNTTPIGEIDADGLILSGGALRVAWEAPKLGNAGEYLDNFKKPILGLCAGHQFMALHFGGEAGPAALPEYGHVELEVTEPDDLFKGLPPQFTVWGNHNDEVKRAPGFKILAKSKDCPIQAMKHETHPLYGLQFHPEVNDTQFGNSILANFIEVCGGTIDPQLTLIPQSFKSSNLYDKSI